MAVVERPTLWIIALGALVMLSLVSSAAPCQTFTASLIVPTGTGNPPPTGTQTTNHGINAFFVPAGDTFSLAAIGPVTCLDLGTCNHQLPDFNVAWFATGFPFDTQLWNNNAPGGDGGGIPSGADYGLVYMRYGPDGLGDGGATALASIQICD